MELRPYQQTLHDSIFQNWAMGYRNVMAVLPTGGGKTITFAHVVNEEQGASIVLAHRAELVSQISLALAREKVRHRIIGQPALIRLCVKAHLSELKFSYYDANAKAGVGSMQSVISYKDTGGWLQSVRLWVHDEAHHLLRDNQFGRAVARFPNARGLGVTATPGRTDGKGLGSHADGLMDVMVMGPSPCELIDAGYLSRYKIFVPPSDLDLSGVKISASGEFSPPELRAATSVSSVMGDVVSHYVKHAPGKSGLTFADSIENATDIAARYRAAGVKAEVLTGKTPDTLRAHIIAQFKNREIQQIVSVALIDEGFDCPGVEVVSDAAATQSFNRFAQRFGRGLRVMAGKSHMIYFDHVGNTLRHGLPDAPREWTLDRRDKRANKATDAPPLRICANPQCLQPYERFYKCCPHCGFYPEPTQRGSPEFVDGDLTELDEATLAALRGDIGRIDGLFYAPGGLEPIAIMAARKRHIERQQAQGNLRNAIAWWAGVEAARGHDESESYRRFYFKFGIDVAGAQTLGVRDADALAQRVNSELGRFGIDGTVSASAYSVNEI